MKFLFNDGKYAITLFEDGIEDNITIETNPDGLGIELLHDNSGKVLIGTIVSGVYFNPILSIRIAKNVQILPDGTAFAIYEDTTYKVEVMP